MTIKTVLQASNASTTTDYSDMTKRRAVRKNLFGTTVDRDELNRQLRQLDEESNRALQSYQCDSVLGLIDRSDRDWEASKSGKLKRLSLPGSSFVDSESDESARDEASSSSSSSSASSSSPQPSSANPSSSTKYSNIPHIQPNMTLTSGQKTIKGEEPSNPPMRYRKLTNFFSFRLLPCHKTYPKRSLSNRLSHTNLSPPTPN